MTALSLLAETSVQLAATSKRTQKRALLVSALRACEPSERGLAASYLAGSVRQPKLGVGYAQLAGMRELPAAAAAELQITEVDALLERIAAQARWHGAYSS